MGNTQQPTRIATITPAMAEKYLKVQEVLESNDPLMRNRNIKEDKLNMYARDMEAERWELNGEPIIFASNGRILDGQHRLLACVRAGKAFRTHIVENVPHSAMRTIDSGAVRTAGDKFTIAGRLSGTRLASALAILFKWEAADKKGFDWRARPTHLELFDMLEKHSEVERFVSGATKFGTIMSPGLAAALWFIFDKQDRVLAEQFFDALASGTNLTEDEPVFILRERLLKERRDQVSRKGTKYLSVDYTTELVYKAWDATRRGVRITKLQRASQKLQSPRELLTRRVSRSRSRKEQV